MIKRHSATEKREAKLLFIITPQQRSLCSRNTAEVAGRLAELVLPLNRGGELADGRRHFEGIDVPRVPSVQV
jgi:hypothetical protein